MDNVPVHTAHGASSGRKSKMKKFHPRNILIAAAVVVLVGVIVVFGLTIYRSSTSANIDSTKYQAVFFTNGQVYFGKLQVIGGGYMKLNDIFYLQATATDSENPQATASDTASDVQLIKLGDEIHGPEDEMIISNDQVLFFENLKKDGKVTQSINQYRAQ